MRIYALPKAHEGPNVVMSSVVVALLALPAPLRMVHNIDSPTNHMPREILFTPVEPANTLEQKIPVIPIHPMNMNPKKILGDQFVDRLRIIDQRAAEINSIANVRIATAR